MNTATDLKESCLSFKKPETNFLMAIIFYFTSQTLLERQIKSHNVIVYLFITHDSQNYM